MPEPQGADDFIGMLFLWGFIICPGAMLTIGLVVTAIINAITRAFTPPAPDYRQLIEDQRVLGDARQARELEIHNALLGGGNGYRPQFED